MTVVLSRGIVSEFLKYLDALNITYELETYKKLKVVFVHISYSEKSHVCDILSEFVINSHIKKYVNSYLLKEFYFFDENDRKMLAKKVLSKVKKADILKSIESFFNDKNEIILDGFFKFRMRDYMEYVNSLILDAADDIIAENELSEFVNLLKYFVAIGDDTCEIVHVFKKDGNFILEDDNGKSPVDALSVMYEFSDMEHLPEDELLNNLVSIAPKRIVMHNTPEETDNELSLIYRVFENSIEFCNGKCKRCQEIYNVEKPPEV